jgi:hypothetical protein
MLKIDKDSLEFLIKMFLSIVADRHAGVPEENQQPVARH